MLNQKHMSARRLAAYLLLWNTFEVEARPNPQEQPPVSATEFIVPITSVGTVDVQPVTAVYTPTSFSIDGLVPPVTEATTVTITDDAGATVAVAVGVGAGIVGAGALAAWLFEPIPGAPPAPTEPPAYTTEDQPEQPETEEPDEPEETPTTSEAPSCPFPTEGPGIDFEEAGEQPEVTIEIPSQTTSSYSSECTPSNDNGLLRGSSPEFIKELSVVFCENDLSGDVTKLLGKDDLPDDSSWKRDDGPTDKIEFVFDFKENFEGCDSHCEKAYSRLISNCQYNSHYLYGNGGLEQGCGTYSLKIKGEPIMKLECSGEGDDPLRNYMYRDSAMEAIENFCGAQDGKTVEKGNDDSFISETAFSVTYADECGGSGEYTIEKDLCVEYLSRTVDDCDTNTKVYKHGGGIKDVDNCGLFEFHPKHYDLLMCYPENKDKGYITAGEHAVITKSMAEDAISAFCDRSGDGQQYTLDPDNRPDTGSFVQDTCKEEGWASCGYFYNNDGSRVDGDGTGDILIRLEASHFNPNDAFTCDADKKYEIHGDRCHQMMAKVIGEGPGGDCVAGEDEMDLGTFIEVGDKGCVTWNAWAVKTS